MFKDEILCQGDKISEYKSNLYEFIYWVLPTSIDITILTANFPQNPVRFWGPKSGFRLSVHWTIECNLLQAACIFVLTPLI